MTSCLYRRLSLSHVCFRYHYAITYQRGKAYKMYINGQVAATLTTVNDALRTFTAGSLPEAHLGCETKFTYNLQGLFRDFRVYNRTLT